MSPLFSFVIPVRTRSITNQRVHWRTRHAQSKKERIATRFAALSAGLTPSVAKRLVEQAPLRIAMVRIARRELDDDNLAGALKSCRDEIALLLGLDDRDKRLKFERAQRQGNPKEWAVEVTVEAAP